MKPFRCCFFSFQSIYFLTGNGLHTTTKNDMHEFYVNDRALISLLGFSDHLYCVLCSMSILDDISYIEIYFILLIILMSFLSFIHIYFDYEINVLFYVLSYPFYSGTTIQSFSRTTEAGRHLYHGDKYVVLLNGIESFLIHGLSPGL